MNETTDAIKAKIRALLAKAECATVTDAESNLFLAKAQELMAKHQLELFDLNVDDPLGWLRPETDYQPGPTSYRSDVHNACAVYYGCQVIKMNRAFLNGKGKWVRGWRLEFAGTESSRLTLELMFPFIWQQVNRQADYVVAHSKLNKGQAVREVAKALCVRIFLAVRARRTGPGQQTGTCYSLVVVDSIEALVTSAYPDLKAGKSKKVKTNVLAKEAAAGINLSHQMNTKDTLRIE